jgi:Flp pilus assembly protein TadD
MSDLDVARRNARLNPDDIQARMVAAYACDGAGAELEAVGHYDAAWALGVPAEERADFLVGYGSTLRNVGRVEEAVAVLGDAIEQYPNKPALKAFLVLALHAAGLRELAMATAIDVMLDLGQGALDGYGRALAGYRDGLLDSALSVAEP